MTFSLVDSTGYVINNGSEPEDTGPVASEVNIPELVAGTQMVYVSSSTKSEDGTQETVVISYNSDDTTATGLGIRIHFDDSVLSLADTPEINAHGALLIGPTEQDDADDFDADSMTGSLLNVAWASFAGNWPGEGPVELATLTFDIAEGATGSSAINFSSTSTMAGYEFSGPTHQVALGAEVVDEPIEDPVEIESQLTINSETGEVTLKANPDYEAQSEYNFSVVAIDAAGNQSEAQAVSLSINNLDEVSPVITSGDTAVAIDENSGAGQVIYTATADDSADISGGVTFSLSADSDAALSIDADTGAVTLSANPDYEAQSEYNFSVVATDAARNPIAVQAVSLSINNLDEVSPAITSGAVADAIDENSGSGQVIYTATADDSADISGGVTFSLSADSDAALSIDADTGAVTLSTDPDFEAQSAYNFSVIATDAAGNESAAQAVTLDINNLDEVSPVITSGAVADAIDENSGADQVIYTATADDSADISGGVTFSLVDSTGYVINNGSQPEDLSLIHI